MDHDRTVALLAERQHGLVTRPQALRLGLSASGVDRRLAHGTWERLYDGVYRLTGSLRSWEQSAVAACLAAGPGSVVSHRCAARVLSMPGAQERIEITVLQSRRIERSDVTVHRALRLDRADRMRFKQIPVTSVARTLIDLAGVLEADELEAVLDHVLGNRRAPLAYLHSRLAALGTRGRRGAGVLAELLAARATVVRALQSTLDPGLPPGSGRGWSA